MRLVNLAKGTSKKCTSIFLRIAVLSLLVVCSIAWKASATDTEAPNLLRLRAAAGAGLMPGTLAVAEDIDGDQRPDFIAARIAGNGYRIVIALSTRSELTTLRPPTHVDVVTVHVCDVNNDAISDILVRSPIGSTPVAVWLGRGNGKFEPADQNLFRDESGFAASETVQDIRLGLDGELLLNPPQIACEKPEAAALFADPDLREILAERPVADSLPGRLFRLIPRGPPIISAI